MTDAKSPELPPNDQFSATALHFVEDEADDGGDGDALLPAHPAATLIVFHRAAAHDAPRLLMVRRSTSMVFAGGAAVFPGGRVDEDDHRLAQPIARAHGLDIRDAAARVAAIRETLEETGLGMGIVHDGPAGVLASIREELLAGAGFSGLLERFGAGVDVSALMPFARWRPNFKHARIFDTRFYVSWLSGPTPDLSLMGGENSALFWIGAQEALDQADGGALSIIFPTRRNLERLAAFDSVDAVHASVLRYPPRRITPFLDERGGVSHLCIPDDCGYPVTAEPFDAVRRG